MDTSQVTVGQFKQFVGDSGYDYDDWNYVAEYSPTNQYPMIYVDWYDAMAYAAWAYTIRGGLRGKCYAWGMIKGSYVLTPIIITQMKTIQLDFFSTPPVAIPHRFTPILQSC